MYTCSQCLGKKTMTWILHLSMYKIWMRSKVQSANRDQVDANLKSVSSYNWSAPVIDWSSGHTLEKNLEVWKRKWSRTVVLSFLAFASPGNGFFMILTLIDDDEYEMYFVFCLSGIGAWPVFPMFSKCQTAKAQRRRDSTQVSKGTHSPFSRQQAREKTKVSVLDAKVFEPYVILTMTLCPVQPQPSLNSLFGKRW